MFALWLGRNSRRRVFVKDIRQLCFFKISRYSKFVVGNRIEAYTCDGGRNFRQMPRIAGAVLACMVFFIDDHAHPDRQPREIAKIGHFRIRRVPKFRFDRLELRQDSTAVRILRSDPIGRLKIGSFVGVLLGILAVDHFPLASRCQSGFVGACFVAAELV